MRKGTNVYAWRAIRQGEDITIEYRLNAFTDECWDCACGSAQCSGQIIGSFFALDSVLQQTYLPYTPAFIRAEHRCRRLTAGSPS